METINYHNTPKDLSCKNNNIKILKGHNSNTKPYNE